LNLLVILSIGKFEPHRALLVLACFYGVLELTPRVHKTRLQFDNTSSKFLFLLSLTLSHFPLNSFAIHSSMILLQICVCVSWSRLNLQLNKKEITIGNAVYERFYFYFWKVKTAKVIIGRTVASGKMAWA
jgi:hypothetical protein